MKKITLSKETLRELTPRETAAVAGGATDTHITCMTHRENGCGTGEPPPTVPTTGANAQA